MSERGAGPGLSPEGRRRICLQLAIFVPFAAPVTAPTSIPFSQSLAVLAVCGLAALVWWMALSHHRGERAGGRQVMRELVAVVGYAALASTTVALLTSLLVIPGP